MVEQGPAVLAAGVGWVGLLFFFHVIFFIFFFMSSILSFFSNASFLWRGMDILKYCGLGR